MQVEEIANRYKTMLWGGIGVELVLTKVITLSRSSCSSFWRLVSGYKLEIIATSMETVRSKVIMVEVGL